MEPQYTTDEIGRVLTLNIKSVNRQKTSDEILCATEGIKELLSTSFGPFGCDKVIVSKDEILTLSNDGATIMEKLPTDNPITLLLQQLSKAQDIMSGDGTTSCVLLTCCLYKQAHELLGKEISPVKLTQNLSAIGELLIEHLDKYKIQTDELMLARSSLSSKIVSVQLEKFSKISVALSKTEHVYINRAGSLKDTILYDGFLLNKEVSHCQMSKSGEGLNTILLCCPLEPPKLKNKYDLVIKDREGYDKLNLLEKTYFLKMITRFKALNINCVVCQYGFDDEANSLLLKSGIIAVRWVGGGDLDLLAKYLNCRIVSRIEDITPEDVCIADFAEVYLNDATMVKFVNRSVNFVTCVLRGSSEQFIEEVKRSINDAICIIKNTKRGCIYGGGAAEAYMRRFLSILPSSVYVRAFINTFDEIIGFLISNAGLDSLKSLTSLHALHEKRNTYGIGEDGICDMKSLSVVESIDSKINQLRMSIGLVNSLLKIDSINI